MPIPTIQELEAEASKDDDAQSLFATDTAAAPGMQHFTQLFQYHDLNCSRN